MIEIYYELKVDGPGQYQLNPLARLEEPGDHGIRPSVCKKSVIPRDSHGKNPRSGSDRFELRETYEVSLIIAFFLLVF